MPPLIVIRTDASPQIGSGHVRRCQSLADALLDCGATVNFLVRSGASNEPLFTGRGYDVSFLPKREPPPPGPTSETTHAHWLGTTWLTDAEDTLATLGHRQVAAVVVDHYALDASWHEHVSAKLHCPLVAIDDLADRDIAAQLIVDHNHAEDHTAKYRAVNRRTSPVLGGPRFALLAKRFHTASKNPATEPVHSVGVFMGGIDLDNYSERTVLGLRNTAGFTGTIEIISTRSNPNLMQLQRLVAFDHRCLLNLDLPDLADFFGRHELHIGAGGGATWERCCLGAPSLAVIVADNQRQVLDPLARMDVLALTDSPEPTAVVIGTRARELIHQPELRRHLSNNAIRLVDGQGAMRVAQEIASLCRT